MPGKRLNAVARDMVVKLVEYFNQKKCNGGPLLLLQAVHEHTSNALGISMRMVQRICKETCEEQDASNNTVVKYGPRKKNKTKDLVEARKMDKTPFKRYARVWKLIDDDVNDNICNLNRTLMRNDLGQSWSWN